MSASAVGQIDPSTLAVLANRLDAICREMNNTLLRAGRSGVLTGARDFSCGVVTADDRLLASADGLPVHVLGLDRLTSAMNSLHSDLQPGDAFLHNDPYLGNTHPADHTLLVPVFVEGAHLFTACAKAHQADCGNSRPTTYMPEARDVYEEGALIFPCVRVQRGYADVGDVIRMCQRRIRVPEVWYGDYLAALGAARVGERSLQRLCAKYGVDVVRAFIEEWFDYSERRMGDAIGRLPSRTLIGESTHDPYPGLPEGLRVRVSVEIDAQSRTIVVDTRDNPDCLPIGLNQSETCATSNVIIGVLNSLGADVPRNAGSFRRLEVRLRENCVVGIPVHPSSCSMATTNLSERLINATQRAFAELGDGFGLAEGAMGMPPSYAVISGVDRREGGRSYVNQIFLGSGGGPGAPTIDGWPTYFQPDAAGVEYRDSVEVDEQRYPFVVWEQRLIADSGGAGRQRGAPGSRFVMEPVGGPMRVAYSAEAHHHPPRGVRGGRDGSPSAVRIIGSDGEERDLPLVGEVDLKPGERIVGITCGGGGYGEVRERDPEAVMRDYVEGLISPEAARDVYGLEFVDEAGRACDRGADRQASAHHPGPRAGSARPRPAGTGV
jgi:N-methylhydantoinase B